MPQKGRTKQGDPYVEVGGFSIFCRVFTVIMQRNGRHELVTDVRYSPTGVQGAPASMSVFFSFMYVQTRCTRRHSAATNSVLALQAFCEGHVHQGIPDRTIELPRALSSRNWRLCDCSGHGFRCSATSTARVMASLPALSRSKRRRASPSRPGNGPLVSRSEPAMA